MSDEESGIEEWQRHVEAFLDWCNSVEEGETRDPISLRGAQAFSYILSALLLPSHKAEDFRGLSFDGLGIYGRVGGLTLNIRKLTDNEGPVGTLQHSVGPRVFGEGNHARLLECYRAYERGFNGMETQSLGVPSFVAAYGAIGRLDGGHPLSLWDTQAFTGAYRFDDVLNYAISQDKVSLLDFGGLGLTKNSLHTFHASGYLDVLVDHGYRSPELVRYLQDCLSILNVSPLGQGPTLWEHLLLLEEETP